MNHLFWLVLTVAGSRLSLVNAECHLSEYECETNKYQPGENVLTYYHVTQDKCASMCCEYPGCIGFDYTLWKQQRCHLSRNNRVQHPLQPSSIGTTQCQRKVTEWTSWGPCSQSCGPSGRSKRIRTCLAASCTGVLEDERVCNNMLCPGCSPNDYDCQDGQQQLVTALATHNDVTEGQCSTNCCNDGSCLGYSYTTSTKECKLSSADRATSALQPATGVRQCQKKVGEWTQWGDCTATCGTTGRNKRTRQCLNSPCTGAELQQERVCNSVACPGCAHSDYTCSPNMYQYGVDMMTYLSVTQEQCSAHCCNHANCVGYDYVTSGNVCRLSQFTRTQVALVPGQGVTQCQKTVGEWTTWSSCSGRCGTTGKSTRTRTCLVTPCTVALQQETVCDAAPCSGCGVPDYACSSNSYQPGVDMETYSYVTKDQCATYCCNRAQCVGYVYVESTKACRLSSKSRVEVALQTKDGETQCEKTVCALANYECESNKYQPGSVMLEVDDKTNEECVQECCQRTECVGFAYEHSVKKCRLSRNSRSTVPLRHDSGKTQCQKKIPQEDGGWSTWTLSSCSRNCGGGSLTKTRSCNNPTPRGGGQDCWATDGIRRTYESITESCNTQDCLVTGWTSWQLHSCSKTCGGGTQTKTRSCSQNQNCKTTLGAWSRYETVTAYCNTVACRVDGGWSNWQSYTCSKTCGGGSQTKTRSCNNPTPASGGMSCWTTMGAQNTYESITASCNMQACTVNGGWGSWTTYTCSKTCGGGMQSKTRWCNNPTPKQGGLNCWTTRGTRGTSETTSVPCNRQSCPASGVWSTWRSYSCSKTCGGGVLTKTRNCNNPTTGYGAQGCRKLNGVVGSHESITESCNMQTCTVGGTWSNWQTYSCSKDCGGGVQTKTRYCTNYNQGYQSCKKTNGETSNYESITASCNTQSCSGAAAGSWSNWQAYACSKTCGTGSQTKTRYCRDANQRYGYQTCTATNGVASYYESITASCNTQSCTVGGTWGNWQSNSCSKDCGGGVQTKTRYCTNSNQGYGIRNCRKTNGETSTYESITVSCNTQSCTTGGGNWANWNSNACSKPCGGGTQTKTRFCTDFTNYCRKTDGTTSYYESITAACNTQGCTGMCSFSDFTCAQSRYQPGTPLDNFYRVTQSECAAKCCTNAQCVGFDYFGSQQTCQLSRNSRTVVSLQMGYGVMQCQKMNVN